MDKLEEKYLNKQLEEYSNYRKKFIEETEHDDIFMVILRVHIYIEK